MDRVSAQPHGGIEPRVVTCAGGSMEPTLRFGDRVAVYPAREVRVGDVVLIERRGGAPVLHRLVWAFPALPWVVHLGDAGSIANPGICRRAAISGRADLPRKVPSYRARACAVRALGRAVIRRFRRGGRPAFARADARVLQGLFELFAERGKEPLQNRRAEPAGGPCPLEG